MTRVRFRSCPALPRFRVTPDGGCVEQRDDMGRWYVAARFADDSTDPVRDFVYDNGREVYVDDLVKCAWYGEPMPALPPAIEDDEE